jgi:hypothetical protein
MTQQQRPGRAAPVAELEGEERAATLAAVYRVLYERGRAARAARDAAEPATMLDPFEGTGGTA